MMGVTCTRWAFFNSAKERRSSANQTWLQSGDWQKVANRRRRQQTLTNREWQIRRTNRVTNQVVMMWNKGLPNVPPICIGAERPLHFQRDTQLTTTREVRCSFSLSFFRSVSSQVIYEYIAFIGEEPRRKQKTSQRRTKSVRPAQYTLFLVTDMRPHIPMPICWSVRQSLSPSVYWLVHQSATW